MNLTRGPEAVCLTRGRVERQFAVSTALVAETMPALAWHRRFRGIGCVLLPRRSLFVFIDRALGPVGAAVVALRRRPEPTIKLAVPVQRTRIKTSLIPGLGALMSSNHNPGSRWLFTRALMLLIVRAFPDMLPTC
jgi:hypothetical protein